MSNHWLLQVHVCGPCTAVSERDWSEGADRDRGRVGRDDPGRPHRRRGPRQPHNQITLRPDITFSKVQIPIIVDPPGGGGCSQPVSFLQEIPVRLWTDTHMHVRRYFLMTEGRDPSIVLRWTKVTVDKKKLLKNP